MFENLKNIIASIVKTNGNEEITGANLQSTLFRMTDELAKIGYKGNATPTTMPVVGDSPMFYLTAISGTYPRMGGLVVDKEIAALIYSGTAWGKQTLIRIDDVPTDGSTNLITSGGVASATSVLTYEQQQAINSGITAALVLEFMDKQDKVDPNISIREGLTSVVGAINQNNENTYDDEIRTYYSWDSYTICREDEWNTDANPLLNITNIQGTQYDAARMILGGDWCIPTLAQIQELADNCSVTTIYNDPAPAPIGYRFTSRINGASITIPTLYLWWNGTTPFGTAIEGAAGITSSEWTMVTTYGPVVNHLGLAGRSVVAGAYIRPVSHTYGIDLGLPSGTRWADANLTEGGLADTSLDLGDFFAFGETFTKYTYVPGSIHKNNRSKHITNRERAIWNAKQNKLTAGDGIIIEGNVIRSTVAGGVTSVAGRTGDVTLTKADVGLENVGNYKAVSTAASQGLSSTEKSNARANIGAGTSDLTIGTTSETAAAGDHTHAEYQPLLTAGYGIDISNDVVNAEVDTYIHGGDDAAREILGGDWRIPTSRNIYELMNTSYCTWTWTSLGGENGYKVTSKVNGNWIFLPATGYREGTSHPTVGSNGWYWSSTITSTNIYNAHYLSFTSSSRDMGGYFRSRGYPIRPVSLTQGVDLGLPSGLRWAGSNLTVNGLAKHEYDYGDFFAWGETETKNSYSWSSYKFGTQYNLTKYNSTDGLTTLELGNELGYCTAHNNILQTRLLAGRGISINNGVISSNNNCAWGVCADDKSVLNKVATTNNPITLAAGVRVYVQFTSTTGTAPASGNMTLNVDGTGAKDVYRNGVTGSSRTRMTYSHIAYFAASKVIEFIYDGTYWNIIG